MRHFHSWSCWKENIWSKSSRAHHRWHFHSIDPSLQRHLLRLNTLVDRESKLSSRETQLKLTSSCTNFFEHFLVFGIFWDLAEGNWQRGPNWLKFNGSLLNSMIFECYIFLKNNTTSQTTQEDWLFNGTTTTTLPPSTPSPSIRGFILRAPIKCLSTALH